jgi:hypothetical protein
MIRRSHNWPAKLGVLIAAVATLLFPPLSGYAQTLTTGAIAGDVTDPTGATVPNATVTATNMGTGEVRTTTTSTAGHYIVPQLTSREYNVFIAASGFQTQEQGPITVRISQTMDVNFRLEIGKRTETVESRAKGRSSTHETPTPRLQSAPLRLPTCLTRAWT